MARTASARVTLGPIVSQIIDNLDQPSLTKYPRIAEEVQLGDWKRFDRVNRERPSGRSFNYFSLLNRSLLSRLNAMITLNGFQLNEAPHS